jgi:hypothetical protein
MANNTPPPLQAWVPILSALKMLKLTIPSSKSLIVLFIYVSDKNNKSQFKLLTELRKNWNFVLRPLTFWYITFSLKNFEFVDIGND